MKFSNGNEKLGTNCYIVSRPVGDTCPFDCFFLENGCYAERTEKRFQNARKASFNNITVNKNEIIDLIKLAEDNDCSIRLHERGDFGIGNKPDKDYLKSWKQALSQYSTSVKLWAYTHFLHSSVSDLQNYGIQMYASTHTEEDIKKAMKAGFSLFAHILPEKKKKGGSKDHAKKVDLPILGSVHICPEQIRGRSGTKAVTCTGSKTSVACTLCTRGFSNIAFLTH